MDCTVSVSLHCRRDGDAIGFGKGIVMLLERIEQYGSINRATADMGMAYSKAWRILKATEQEFGLTLVYRDGARGSKITEGARKLMEAYYAALEKASLAAEGEVARRNM